MTAVITKNQKLLSKQAESIQSKVPTIAVVKNDAYNFGLKETYEAFYKAGIRSFTTTNLKEAIELRQLDGTITVLLLDPSLAFDELREYQITATIPSLDYYRKYRADLEGIPVHLVFKNDLNRLGFTSSSDMQAVLDDSKINVTGLWTHFGYADDFESAHYVHEVENWNRVLDDLNDYLPKLSCIHAQNSASYARDGLHDRHTHIRCGVFLYGTRPYYHGIDQKNARQTVEVSANVIELSDVQKGENAGYSAAFTASEDTRLAVCDIGYGNGLMPGRKAFPVIINGKEWPIRVMMMSHLLVEVDETVSVGDEVVLYNGETLRFDWFTEQGLGSFSQQMAALNVRTFTERFISC